jgi:hypothetical protein
VIRSGFVPKLLGVFLLVGGVAYLADSSLALFAPELRAETSSFLMVPLAIGELAMVVWLLARGPRGSNPATAPKPGPRASLEAAT